MYRWAMCKYMSHQILTHAHVAGGVPVATRSSDNVLLGD